MIQDLGCHEGLMLGKANMLGATYGVISSSAVHGAHKRFVICHRVPPSLLAAHWWQEAGDRCCCGPGLRCACLQCMTLLGDPDTESPLKGVHDVLAMTHQ
jgi:hypothetical protein